MRKAIIVLMVMAITGTAVADDVDLSGKGPVKNTPTRTYTPPAEVKLGGDNITDATVIPGLPYSDTGNTCNFTDDYDEACPSVSISPDVVYSYTPGSDINIDVDLCGSGYDTKTFIYDSGLNLIECNDDFYSDAVCGLFVSKIENAALTGGETYFIVIDGWNGDCGEYVLEVSEHEPPPPCNVVCHDDAITEDEPPLVDGYIDLYNSGCNTDSHAFQNIWWANTDAGEAWLCGVSGWYITAGSNYRDTDWFTATADASGTMSFTVEAEYPCYIFHMTIDELCNYVIIEQAIARCGFPETITISTTENEVVYWWVGPTVFSSPDGTTEFPYFATLTGHIWDPPVANEEMSWGGVKALYR